MSDFEYHVQRGMHLLVKLNRMLNRMLGSGEDITHSAGYFLSDQDASDLLAALLGRSYPDLLGH